MRCSLVLLLVLMSACGSNLTGDAPDDLATAGPAPASVPSSRFVARPIAPLSTARVFTNRPTLRWALPPHARGARVELCVDRACTQILSSIDVPGNQVTMEDALPAGVVYWRLRPLHGHPQLASPTWEFFVDRDTPVDSAWRSVFDVNGDGYADVAVTSSSNDLVFVFLGGASGLATTPARVVGVELFTRSGHLADIGDVDGDGFPELAVVSGDELVVYRGDPLGLATTEPQRIPLAPEFPDLRHSFGSIGDFDGDGHADLVVADPRGNRALVYFGGDAGLDLTRTLALVDPDASAASHFAAAVAGAGDVDGDGLGDVIVGAPGAGAGAGRAYLFRGGERDGASAATFAPPAEAGAAAFGTDVASAGDVDGDGLADVVIGAPGAPNEGGFRPGRAYVIPGAGGNCGTTAIALPPPLLAGSGFGVGVASGGDLDGDGFDEVAVIDNIPTPDAGLIGGVALFRGAPGGTATTAWQLLTDGNPGGGFGRGLASPGDIDGDRRDELIIGAPTAPTSLGGSRFGAGRVHVFGVTSAASPTPNQTLAGEDYFVRGFGVAVE